MHIDNGRALHYENWITLTKDIQIDYIVVSQVLLHIKEYVSLLKPDGYLVIIDFDKNENISSDKVHNGFVHKGVRRSIRYDEI